MVSLSDLRSRIANRIFTSSIKSTALLASLTSPSNDKWGDQTGTYSAGSSIDVVPFMYVDNRLNYQPFGDLQEGEVDFVVQYSTTVTPTDQLTWQGDTYFITEVDDSAFLGNGLVVRVIRCRRVA